LSSRTALGRRNRVAQIATASVAIDKAPSIGRG
jgi:hypothetical protein